MLHDLRQKLGSSSARANAVPQAGQAAGDPGPLGLIGALDQVEQALGQGIPNVPVAVSFYQRLQYWKQRCTHRGQFKAHRGCVTAHWALIRALCTYPVRAFQHCGNGQNVRHAKCTMLGASLKQLPHSWRAGQQT